MTVMSNDQDVVIRREDHAGRITLNRPKALNALTLPMVRAIAPALAAWASDPAIELIILDGAGDRGLCAGGDVRWLYDSRLNGPHDARTFWAEEYKLNAMIGRYAKPFVAFMDGVVMGGGIGLSAHGSHRIVTERSQLAMPETSIGLIPDVGGTWLLSRAPGELGAYLGLTGERMKGAGTIAAGFADTFAPSSRLQELGAALCHSGAATMDRVIAHYAEAPPPSDLAGLRALIDETFKFDQVELIRDTLARMSKAGTVEPGQAWAVKTLAGLAGRSPLSLKLALTAIRHARGLPSLEAALDMEYRICTRLYEGGEFIEGVRALIVDKDRQPKWQPPRLEDVTPELVVQYLAPLPAGQELGLHAD